MARSDSSASVNLSVSPQSGSAREDRPASDTPFRVLVLGDFSGRRNRAAAPAPALPREVTPENVDDLPGSLGTSLKLTVAGISEFSLHFRDIDGFHPETILRQIPEGGPVEAPAAPPDAEPERPPLPELGSVLDAILGGGAAITPAPARAKDPLRAAIDRIVEPHTVKEPSAAELQRAAIEAQSEAGRLRLVLSHRDVRELESNWRTLFWMLSKLPTGVELQVHVVDMAKSEAAAELAGGGGKLARLLVDDTVGTAGGTPWAVLAALWPIEASEADLDLVYGMGQLARAAGAPFLAGADPLLAGCADVRASADPREWTGSLPPTVAGAWAAVRGSDVAPWIGLTTPRWLVRLPYGKGGLSSDVEALEEAATGVDAANFVWGSGAAFCATLLGMAFDRDGWDLSPESSLGIDGMPVYVRGSGVTAEAMSSTEAWLGERAAEQILDCGLMPLVALKNRDVVRIVRWQSIAAPHARLQGRWE